MSNLNLQCEHYHIIQNNDGSSHINIVDMKPIHIGYSQILKNYVYEKAIFFDPESPVTNFLCFINVFTNIHVYKWFPPLSC